jgi:hypothetical protein
MAGIGHDQTHHFSGPISGMGQTETSAHPSARSALPPINGHRQRSAARIIGAERPASRRYRSVR